MIKISLLIFTILLFAGCSKAPTYPVTVHNMTIVPSDDSLTLQTSKDDIDTKNLTNDEILSKLYEKYKKWDNTPYKYGGVCLDGVDCSGFVQLVFKNGFKIDLPRNTTEQMKVGRKVALNELKVGDLVFFKTGRTLQHVGVYLGKNKFMHSSTSYGVTISNIKSNYWRRTYITSRRVLTPLKDGLEIASNKTSSAQNQSNYN